MKNYKLIYYDKNENELQVINITAENFTAARKQRDAALIKTKLNDCFKIKIIN